MNDEQVGALATVPVRSTRSEAQALQAETGHTQERRRRSGLAERLVTPFVTAGELFLYLGKRKRGWLIPLIVLLLLLGVVLAVVQAAQYVAPFVYTIF